ncbi:MAG: DUF2298 domain-containing protein [Dongiaceae bacterium]
MRALYFLSLATVVYVDLLALTLVFRRLLPMPAIARAAGALAVTAGLFFVEHFVGLGRLQWALPPLTAVSCLLLWRWRAELRAPDVLAAEAVFLAAAAYALLWRLAFPELFEHLDQLTDLHLIANYLPGERLPPPDRWLPWQRLDYYYTLQQYGAALLGRLAGLGPGTCFNAAFVLLTAMIVGLAWCFAEAVGAPLWGRLLAVFCLAIGGSGLAPFYHLVTAPPAEGTTPAGAAWDVMVHSYRFIGWFGEATASPLWRSLFGVPRQDMVLPLETFGQEYAFGAYHAPLAGFLLLFLAMAAMAVLPRAASAVRQHLRILLGASVPLTLAANAWTFPLQGLLVGSWALWLDGPLRLARWRALAAGAALGTALVLPFLAGFAVNGHGIALTRVAAHERAPVLQFLLLFWPLLLAALLAPLAGRNRALALRLAVSFVGLLVATELLNAYDGGYSGTMARFNPAMKWWSWIFTGGFFALSACLLGSGRRGPRAAGAVLLLLVSSYAVDVGRFWLVTAKPHALRFDGMGHYAADPAAARLIAYLSAVPEGLLLEKAYDKSPIDTGTYGSFTGQPNLVGIPWVLRVWKAELPELGTLLPEIGAFYGGTHPDPLRFLTGQGIRYVLWSPREGGDLAAWARIDAAIAAGYRWMEFSATPDRHVGVWVRRPS